MLSIGQFVPGIKPGLWQSAPAKNTQLVLENNRGKSARSGDALNFDSVAKMMRKNRDMAPFDIDACSAFLNKEIRSGNIVGDDSTNPDGVTTRSLVGSKPSHLFHMGEQRERR